MTIQIKNDQRSKKAGRVRMLQPRSNKGRAGLTGAKPNLRSTNGNDNRNPTGIKAYAAQSATSALGPFAIKRRDVGGHDVRIEILYCGVCHSDLH